MVSLVKMRWLIWLARLFCLLLLSHSQHTSSSSFTSSSALLCSQDQSSALLQFKQSFSFSDAASLACDYSHPKMEAWKEGTDCCSWDGVTCNRLTGDVSGLDLSCSWLHGTIPTNSTLFLLPHLQWLNLAFNDFNNSLILSGFGKFAKLRYLNLSYSKFDGQFPFELSHPSQLASLDLSGNKWVRPETSVLKIIFQNLTKLTELHLDFVNMSSVSVSSFINLSSSLTSLTLSNCGLQGKLPVNIFLLPNLRELRLDENSKLSGFFPMANWTIPLRFLNISKTAFSGELPKLTGNLKFLRHLGLSQCNFTGSIPASLGNLTQLTHLDLSLNHFSGEIPTSLSNLKDLSCMFLHQNNLNGSLPESLGNLTKVTQIFLKSNNFTGQIPLSLSNLEDLSFVDLSYNNFGGKIPNFLSNLTKLTEVYLSYNQLTSQIGEFQPSNSLQILRLENNKIHGSIPKSLSNLVNLIELDISSNNLSGIVEFNTSTKLKKLRDLDLSYNSLLLSVKSKFNYTFPALKYVNLVSCNITEFPNFLLSSEKLEYLDLSNNRIYGRIPNWMFEIGENLSYLYLSHNFVTSIDLLPWKSLIHLDLRANLLQGKFPVLPSSVQIFLISDNNLTGGISSMICNVSSLRLLDISHNSLDGTIPQCLGNFSKFISVMDFRMNNFRGAIPDTFAKAIWLIPLVLNGNQFEGLLPKSLVNCTKLEILDFGNNEINDFFPYWVETLPELKVLILKSNRFHGPIRNHKTSRKIFSNLRILDLSHNEFTGVLPRNYFHNLNAMMNNDEGKERLYMGGNKLCTHSVMVTVKGLEIKLQKILTIFTMIDLSCNKFEGAIPKVLGRLKILRLLNLSHNSLTGHIPSSLANLSVLESLDLSSNRLIGVIPMQLTSLTFLAMLNLSQNQLTGPIPQGKQFATFENNSYDGNMRLCGFPLSIKCSTNELTPPTQPSIVQQDYDSLFESGFGWKAVLIGYGCGLLFGLAMGYVVFKIRKPKWIVTFVEGEKNDKKRMSNNQRPRQRRN